MTEYNLTNAGSYIHDSPEIIDHTFDLSETAYLIKVRPGTNFWRFGLRFSQTETCEFVRAFEEYDWGSSIYKDVYFSVGIRSNNEWIRHDQLNVGQFNFEVPERRIKYHNNYKQDDGGVVDIFVKRIPKRHQVLISYTAENCPATEILLPLYDDFKYLKIFSWLDDSYYTIDVAVDAIEFREIELNFAPFKVGEITFRRGDMFNKEVIQNSNLIILPASSNGTVSPNIYYRASELNMPLPPKLKAGSVKLFELSNHKWALFGGYAYSVTNDKSSTEIIRKICVWIEENIDIGTADYKSITGINLPLLGTGAGKMDPRNVARIYDSIFNLNDFFLPVIVSIPSGDVFQKIKSMFIDELLPLPHEKEYKSPDIIKRIEKDLSIEIDYQDYELGVYGELIRLDLSKHHFKGEAKLDIIGELGSLQYLNLNNCQSINIEFLAKNKSLKNLYLKNTAFRDFHLFEGLVNLETLDLGQNGMKRIPEVLGQLKQLKRLYLEGNALRDLSGIEELTNLEFLDLNTNYIFEVVYLKNLYNLNSLLLANNQLATINSLYNLKKLVILDISKNQISDLSVLMELKKLNYLIADKNPFDLQNNLILEENENHLSPVKFYYARQAEEDKIPIQLPAKVLLLGNHAAGKSSLLYYLQNKKLGSNLQSTYIINIEKYYTDRQLKKKDELPDAVFFDFGGQDYYHGLYRAFLSGGAVYLVLWNPQHNRNDLRKDSLQVWTQDFSLNYWLAQKRYLETEKYDGEVDPLFIIQTFADTNKRTMGYSNFDNPIDNEFYVSLNEEIKEPCKSGLRLAVNEKSLIYLSSAMDDIITQKKQLKEEPNWYKEFLLYVLKENDNADYKGVALSIVSRHYHYKGSDKKERLKNDLQQLHRQGLILYYKDELPDVVWLNPVALVNFVHKNILNDKDITKFDGVIPEKEFKITEQHITQLLIKQKVLFRHDAGKEYIVPNFLPLAKTGSPGTDLMTFGLGKSAFILKFDRFIPFGLINQIICFFGHLPDQKHFSRDRLIFVLDNTAKVLVNVDFKYMEIKVYCELVEGVLNVDKTDIVKYLFYGIVGLYWDLQILGFKDFIEFRKGNLNKDSYSPDDPAYVKLYHAERFYQEEACRPDDLYISLDEKHYISYNGLCTAESMVMISALTINEHHVLQDESKAIPIFQFQPFTSNILRKRRRAVISYSKQDLILVNKFLDYLIPLADDELIDYPWYCTMLEAGTPWDEEIAAKFNEADIIFFMISENLMGVQYVKDNEIKNAIDKYNKFKNIKIVPILLVPYHWARKGLYDLSKFSALPYTLKPVNTFINQHEAWHMISESIRIMINKNLDPGIPDQLPTELRRMFENIIEKKS